MSRDEVNATVRNAKHKLNKTEDRSKSNGGTVGGGGNYACQVSVRYFLHNLHSHANELGQH